MRIKSPATYLILLVLVCFSAGVVSVLLRPDQLLEAFTLLEAPQQSPTVEVLQQSPASNLLDDDLFTILVMGVDHIADPEGKLLALWMVTFNPGEKQIRLMGLPLDLPLASSGTSIAESFDLWDPPQFGANFINQLAAFAPSPVHGIVALDEHGFAVLLDYFGGVDLDDQHMEGASVIGSLRLTHDNPQAALKLQARVLENLRTRVESLGSTPELTPLTALSPIHAYTSPSPPELATLAIPLLPLEPQNILIEIWTPEQ